MLETGLKNAQICLAILVASFPIEKIGVLEMMPLYFLFFQVVMIHKMMTHYDSCLGYRVGFIGIFIH